MLQRTSAPAAYRPQATWLATRRAHQFDGVLLWSFELWKFGIGLLVCCKKHGWKQAAFLQEVITYVEGLKERIAALEKAQGLPPTRLPAKKEVHPLPKLPISCIEGGGGHAGLWLFDITNTRSALRSSITEEHGYT